MNRKATAAVLGAGSLWVVISIFVRNLNAMGLTAIQISLLRAMGGAAVMVLFLALTRRDLLKIKLRHIWYFIGTGIISLALFNLCYFTAVSYTHLDVYTRQGQGRPAATPGRRSLPPGSTGVVHGIGLLFLRIIPAYALQSQGVKNVASPSIAWYNEAL